MKKDSRWAVLTRVLPGEGERLVQQKVRVSVVDGSDKGRFADLLDEHLLIGTHPQCDLQLTDAGVSRQHAELVAAQEGLMLRDLGSTNGSWIGSVRLREAILPKRTEITVGDSRLLIAALDEHVSHEISSAGRFGEMIGTSPAMRALFSKLQRASASEATVLLQGESGTGKEIAARAIHDHSPRNTAPFVVVDCGALPRDLIESELFGHERGAFTGASHSRQGAFEQANGGTLFLDEIGELDLDLQPKLLRALESRKVKRIGSNQQHSVDIRIVAATNRNLLQRVAEGAFREDLYFRLSVVVLTLPPLRAHREDIPALVARYLDQLGQRGAAFDVSETMMQHLMRRPWPGNARELRNIVERAVALGTLEEPAQSEEMPSEQAIDQPPMAGFVELRELPYKVARARLLDQFERDYLGALLEHQQGNLTQSARRAEIDRVYLLRLLDKHDMRSRSKSMHGKK